ncbi:MAG TPA: type I-B CRISPR-associated protein Cas8b1/Cst1, partial [Exilispira sp.]|nr:type I-B CRISPR-associated protein Cas8b1/Cst1 [Exilispira sp.]
MNEENEIELYTSNWLYNAGVIGFLSCLDRDNYLTNFNDERYCISDNGSININKNIFNSINFYDNYLKDGKVVNLIGKNNYYPNFLSAAGTQNDLFRRYIISLSGNLNEGSCSLCNNGKFISNLDDDKGFNDFLCKMENYNKYHNTLLGPSEKFPNAYWNNKTNIKICHLCAFILIHHHLAFTKLSDGSEIFINSPSFKVMYELNKIVNKLFGREESSQNTRREILAMSIIEYTRRIQTTLGEWNKMNIEIVIKKYEKIYPLYNFKCKH